MNTACRGTLGGVLFKTFPFLKNSAPISELFYYIKTASLDIGGLTFIVHPQRILFLHTKHTVFVLVKIP
jgi:hypothetical protein